MRAQTSAGWGTTELDVSAAGAGRLPVEQVSDSEVEILDDDLDFSWVVAASAVMVEDAAEAATRSLLALGAAPPPFRRFGGGSLVLSEVWADVAGDDEEFAMKRFGEEEFDLTSPTSTACSLGSPVSASLLMKLVDADEADDTHQVAADSDDVHAGEGACGQLPLQRREASPTDCRWAQGLGSSCESPGTLRAVQPLLPVRPKAHTGLLRTSSCSGLGSSLRAASALALDLGEEACKDGPSGSLFRPRGAAVLPPTLPPRRALGASASLPSLSKGRPQDFGKLAVPHRASPLVSDHSAGSLAWGRRSARRAPWLQGTAGRGAAF